MAEPNSTQALAAAERFYGRLDFRRAPLRLVFGVVVGAVGALLAHRHAAAFRLLLGWDAGAFALLGIVVGGLVNWNATSAKPALSCGGEYADSLQMGGPESRAAAPKPAEYTYLVRNSARYECPYFGPDGKLRRRIDHAKEHGTAFAYEVVGQDTYLLTNEHVAVWPEVTDARNRVQGVSDGCKRVEARLRIVHDERNPARA